MGASDVPPAPSPQLPRLSRHLLCSVRARQPAEAAPTRAHHQALQHLPRSTAVRWASEDAVRRSAAACSPPCAPAAHASGWPQLRLPCWAVGIPGLLPARPVDHLSQRCLTDGLPAALCCSSTCTPTRCKKRLPRGAPSPRLLGAAGAEGAALQGGQAGPPGQQAGPPGYPRSPPTPVPCAAGRRRACGRLARVCAARARRGAGALRVALPGPGRWRTA